MSMEQYFSLEFDLKFEFQFMATFSLLVLCVTLCLSQAAVDSDLVSSLPGISFTPKFKSYSGYLKASDTKMLHYW